MLEKITGKVERIIFSSGPYSVGVLASKGGGENVFSGKINIDVGNEVTMHGNWIKHKTYGHQFKVNYVMCTLAIDEKGLGKYLAICPLLKKIDPRKANKAAKYFGQNFETVLLNKPQEIARITSVDYSSVVTLRKLWMKSRTYNAVYTHLARFDLNYFQIETLATSLGVNCMSVLKKDPYAATDMVKKLDFIFMDEIALKIGVSESSPERIRGAIRYILQKNLEREGHCWMTSVSLMNNVLSVLFLEDDSEEIVKNGMREALKENILSWKKTESKNIAIGLFSIYEKELSISNMLKQPHANAHIANFEKIETEIRRVTKGLTMAQREAVKTVMKNPVTLMCGGAGTGKTYTISVMTKIFEKIHLNVSLVAPTGKAARRIEEVTGNKAKTLHMFLGLRGDWFPKKFTNIKDDVLIVDEVSMIDVKLFWYLLSSLNLSKTILVLAGDHNQLPPVGPGNVLRDLVEKKMVPIIVLDEVMRQAGILRENCNFILNGIIKHGTNDTQQIWEIEHELQNPFKLRGRIEQIYDQKFLKNIGFDPLLDVQILSPTNKGLLGTIELNLRLQKISQRKLFNVEVEPATFHNGKIFTATEFYEHDKVIQIKNDYKTGVMNGTIGFVKAKDVNGNITIDFEGKIIKIKNGTSKIKNIQLAYCLSIHKVQGSEFPCVVTIIHSSHKFMHHRNLLYTAMTRAKKTAIILGDLVGINFCVENVENNKRRTFLSLIK